MPEKSKRSGRESLAERSVARLAREQKLKAPLLVGHSQGAHPESGEPLHRFVVVDAADANGPSHRIIVDQRGRAVAATPELNAVFDPATDVSVAARTERRPAAMAGGVQVDPAQNTLTLNPGDSFDETVTVTIPKNTAAPRADVYFLADTTGSMGGVLNAVQAGLNTILSALSGLGIDLAFGVGNYKDFPNDPYAFQHQLGPTTAVANVGAAINAWAASGGSDGPEGQLFALDRLAVPVGPPIGWRTGSKRIVVWFGDMPGHDPVCAAISGDASDITEASVTARLTSQAITVLAISTATPGLDGDPKAGASDYTGVCGAPGGAAGQGSRLAAATGGVLATGIHPGNIVNTIVSLVSAAVASIGNVKLVASPTIAPFVASIAPAAGYGPLPGDQDHVLKFEVKFVGTVPCRDEAQVFSGSLDVVADGVVVGSKRVQITVPACKPTEIVYSVKFVCGKQAEHDCKCAPVRPGHYATEINIHNFSGREVSITKRVIPVVLASAPVGREPATAAARPLGRVTLPPHTATMDDCCAIAEALVGGSMHALTIGLLEITASAEVAVTAVYTSSSISDGKLSIDVQEVTGRRI